MCLVALALDANACTPLTLAANRDEYHRRPADGAHRWRDRPHVLGGRDRRAGGTWLALGAAGRFAALLNCPGIAGPPQPPSRGQLVPAFLETSDPDEWLARLAAERARYAGFHLLAGHAGGVFLVGSDSPEPVRLTPGLHIVDNAGLASATPRAQRAHTRLAPLLEAGASPAALLAALGDRADPPAGDGDRRPVFIADPVFGTRCSTVLRLFGTPWATAALRERRYDASGQCSGETSCVWPLGSPEAPP